ncbi:hypothetical protein CEXT_98141 [Caerostris extrusa]|uniref:Uncharacterized protein n=1 Tax=Caerostris extrusa TaxID=172846 RepID=A0AAV4W1C3_CAEEX|nr:hypothetical protein CEXT_98141 [Caerostris extrusa]
MFSERAIKCPHSGFCSNGAPQGEIARGRGDAGVEQPPSPSTNSSHYYRSTVAVLTPPFPSPFAQRRINSTGIPHPCPLLLHPLSWASSDATKECRFRRAAKFARDCCRQIKLSPSFGNV